MKYQLGDIITFTDNSEFIGSELYCIFGYWNSIYHIRPVLIENSNDSLYDIAVDENEIKEATNKEIIDDISELLKRFLVKNYKEII